MLPGHLVMIDDGKLQLEATACGPDYVEARVVVGGMLSDRKGVNLPATDLPISPLTEKDRADLAFGLDLGVDWVALSFVQRASDVIEAQGSDQGARRHHGQDREAGGARPHRRHRRARRSR